MKPGDDEWNARLAALLADEAAQPLAWWYLSFVGDGTFRGACIIEARGMTTAIIEARRRGINPGGEVVGLPVPAGREDALPHNRLLTRAELGPGGNARRAARRWRFTACHSMKPRSG